MRNKGAERLASGDDDQVLDTERRKEVIEREKQVEQEERQKKQRED